MAGTSGEPIYDMSIGYDLAGIQTPKVVDFIRGMIDARESVERLRDQIPRWLGPLRDLDYPTELSRSITLSTFHGCPADEIERICEFLLTELDVHVDREDEPADARPGAARAPAVRRDGLHRPARERKGVHVRPAVRRVARNLRPADATWPRRAGLQFGAKFSNTLEVENHRDFFQPTEKIMYLSGAPLHVITLTLAGEFRKAVGAAFPISFSAGVDRKNFANLVACGIVPVTTCTDLLKTGGYGRLPPYLHDLQKQMEKVGARTIDDFILDCRGQRDAAGGDPVQAGFLNTPIIVAETQADPRYRAAQNRARAEENRFAPRDVRLHHLRQVHSRLPERRQLLVPHRRSAAHVSRRRSAARRQRRAHRRRARSSRSRKADQIANFADYCNHCGNCDTFCPEYDGPYLKKPNFYGSRQAFEAGAPHDGFLLEGRAWPHMSTACAASRANQLSLGRTGKWRTDIVTTMALRAVRS